MQSSTGMSTEQEEALAANPIAHLRYAALRPVVEAKAILESQVASGAWRKHPGEWLDAGRRLALRDDSPWSGNGFYEWVVEVVTSSTLDHDLAQLLFEVVRQLLGRSPDRTDLLDGLVLWFESCASPGHAPICADLLRWSAIYGSTGKVPAPLLPLVEWLLTNGAAELRATEQRTTGHGVGHAKHHELLPLLVETVAEHARPELLETALRYVLLARVPGCGWWTNSRAAGKLDEVDEVDDVLRRALKHDG